MENDVTAVEPSSTETTATEPVTVTTPAAEPQNTATDTTQEHMIPKSRLDEVIGQRKDALREKEELAERIVALEAAAKPKEPDPKPADGEPEAQAYHHDDRLHSGDSARGGMGNGERYIRR